MNPSKLAALDEMLRIISTEGWITPARIGRVLQEHCLEASDLPDLYSTLDLNQRHGPALKSVLIVFDDQVRGRKQMPAGMNGWAGG